MVADCCIDCLLIKYDSVCFIACIFCLHQQFAVRIRFGPALFVFAIEFLLATSVFSPSLNIIALKKIILLISECMCDWLVRTIYSHQPISYFLVTRRVYSVFRL